MMFKDISKKQFEIFAFGTNEKYDTLICDGAVRSGKTIMMSVAFIVWAMENFSNCLFGICGKSVRSAERNILFPLQNLTSFRKKYSLKYTRTLNLLTVTDPKGHENYFYFYGGKDESSYTLIQGITLHGVLFDEVALMPESFVNQAISRTLSVDNSKLWFNCNPESPAHWFYKKWVKNLEQHRAKRLHFLMEDNPGLSEKAISKAKSDFEGVFYDRYILGKWVAAEGAIYRTFAESKKEFIINSPPNPGDISFSYIGVDFGGNGSGHAFVLTGFTRDMKTAVTIDEWYHKGSLTPTDLEQNFIAFVRRNKDYNPLTAYMDSAEQVLINGIKVACIKSKTPINIANARKGPIIDRIRFHSMLHAKRAYKVCAKCSRLIEALETAVYDPKSIDDKRLDDGSTNIDSLDALEYSTEAVQSNMIKLLGLAR